jgi:tRNA 2-thiouridine synthesizing protein E
MTHPHTDNEGYLQDPKQWTEALATQLAASEHIELTPLHWEIVRFVRNYYLEHKDIPKMRALVTHIQQHAEYAQINSAAIHHLFPLSPALQIAKIAGLPKPKKCL